MNNTSRLPAEWQGHSAVLISWPHAGQDWCYMLDDVVDCYISLARALSRAAHLLVVTPDAEAVDQVLRGNIPTSSYTLVEMPTDDTWARDFGMLCTTDGSGRWVAHDYKFNGWGLKFAASHDNLITRHLMASRAIDTIRCAYLNRLGFVLEGGSIDVDEQGVMLTTSECLLSPNRNGDLSQQQIEQMLKQDFGCPKVIWLNHGALAGDDTDSHIDTLARFIPGGKIAYSSCDRTDDSHYEELRLMEAELAEATDAEGRHYELVALPIPSPIYDDEGQRLPATYANFLIINGYVFLPVYADEHYDAIAVERLRHALPQYEVVTVDCRALIQQHGSLHCVTMQLPAEILSVH